MSRFDGGIARAALIVSVVALAAAVGGGAYAAVKLKNNSVKTKTIKNNAVTGPKIKDGAVTAPKLAKGAVTSASLVGCKGGTLEANGVCFETSLRTPTGYFQAVEICKGVGGRLPSPQELLQARTSGLTLAAAPLGEKSSDLFGDGTFMYTVNVDNTGAFIQTQFASTTIAYRCAFDRI